ncbi:TonB-dependent receptor domain-containing protein [Mangrovimonas aestuarii]|uniref:TonB-dependent receptor domain-containing protein n=1 Tax=Mangrovimonas aestuarii TaxID=3018443 RepID=UPI002379DDE2|nr:TonB-dependent receptor [Mangrovimonas aestuarii]
MNLKQLTLLALLICSLSSWAQKQVTVSGTVLDKETNQPLEYATIAFFNKKENKTTTGSITDENGKFNIKVPMGLYDISVEYISFKTLKLPNISLQKDYEMGAVKLEIDLASLDEVEIVAERTTVDIRLDKKIYNIGKDLTTQGASVTDALANVPSVNVDVEGAISLRGNENVRILINGKPSAMAGFGDTNLLQQIPAEAIERIEVITSPSARYDAEGTAGILNIVLKKEKTLGFNGSISLNTGIPDNHSATVNLNLRTDKFNIFNTTGLYYRKFLGNAHFDNRYFGETVTVDRTIEDRDYDRLRTGINTNFGMEYYLTEKSSITGSIFGRWGDDEDITTNKTEAYFEDEYLGVTPRNQTEKEKDNSYQTSLNYINNFNNEGHKLTADFQFSYDLEDRPTIISSIPNEPGFENQILPIEKIFETEKQTEYLIQADYVRPMGDAQFEAGFRGNYEREVTDYNLDTLNINTNEYLPYTDLNNIFTYDENITAVYSQYGNKIGKFSFLLGLRLENTNLKGQLDYSDDADFAIDVVSDFDKNYLGLFPTANLIYELGEEENISLGYNRRINRPRGWYINPFPSRSSNTNVWQGNPNLNPAYANAFDLGYLKQWKKITLSTSVYFQHETNSFERIQEGTGVFNANDVEIIRTIPINLSTNNRYGGEFSLMYNPTKKLRFNGSFNLFRSETDGEFNGVDYGAENTSWFGRFSSKVTLPASVQWQTSAFYSGPQKNAITESEGIFSMNMAFSKDIIKDKGTLSLNVSDLFNTRKRQSYTLTDDFSSDSEFQWRQRQFTLSFIYRFNQPKNGKGRRDRQNNGGGNGDDMDFG